MQMITKKMSSLFFSKYQNKNTKIIFDKKLRKNNVKIGSIPDSD